MDLQEMQFTLLDPSGRPINIVNFMFGDPQLQEAWKVGGRTSLLIPFPSLKTYTHYQLDVTRIK